MSSLTHLPAHRLPIRETFRDKHLVVTGVTGFLGKVWLAMVLDHLPEVRRVTVLARGKAKEDAHARFERIYRSSPAFRPLRDKLGTDLHHLIADKVRVVDSTLSAPLGGLDEDYARELMADVDAVVHFAGLTDFEPDPTLAVDANIHGASRMADLAALTPTKRYIHCSTCFVVGRKEGDVIEGLEAGVSPNGTRFDPREELRALEAALDGVEKKSERVDIAMARAEALGWPNIYTYTKALSEHLAELRDDVHTVTLRPAIVECANTYPFAGWNEGINTSGPLIWLLSTAFRRLPARNNICFDIIPVDMVCRGVTLAVAAALRDEAAPVYQFASGHRKRLNFERAFDLSNLAIRRHHRKSDSAWDRWVLSNLSAYSSDPDEEKLLGITQVKRLATELRNGLKKVKVDRLLPPALYDKHGEALEERVRKTSRQARMQAKKLGTVEEMLRQFRPFIWDHDYTFHTDEVMKLDVRLTDDERARFGFDIDALDWRHYYVDVQVPGLETWCIPVLRGDKVADDTPLPELPATSPGEQDAESSSDNLPGRRAAG